MKPAVGCLIAFAVPIIALPHVLAEESDKASGPMKGVVVQGRAVTMYEDGSLGGFGLHYAPLAGGLARDGCRCNILQAPPRVWQITHGYLWASGNQKVAGLNDISDTLFHYSLSGFLQDKWITTPEVDENNLHYSCFIGDVSPLSMTRTLHLSVEYDLELYYDYLPTAENEVLLFQLCNVAGADHSGLPGVPESKLNWTPTYITREPNSADESRKKPYWSLGLFDFKNKWDTKAQNWPDGTWKRIGVIEARFHEQFNALSKGDDYYFVTQSGRLYRAPKPDKGTDRKMDTVWKDDQRPIVAFITDADADRSFLFCKPDKDGKGVYFEMSDKPDPQSYEASKVPEAKPDDPLPAVLAYAKILVADKKITKFDDY